MHHKLIIIFILFFYLSLSFILNFLSFACKLGLHQSKFKQSSYRLDTPTSDYLRHFGALVNELTMIEFGKLCLTWFLVVGYSSFILSFINMKFTPTLQCKQKSNCRLKESNSDNVTEECKSMSIKRMIFMTDQIIIYN